MLVTVDKSARGEHFVERRELTSNSARMIQDRAAAAGLRRKSSKGQKHAASTVESASVNGRNGALQ